ncbi:hypothetical protein KI387_000802, partial [Taxus chinensis]
TSEKPKVREGREKVKKLHRKDGNKEARIGRRRRFSSGTSGPKGTQGMYGTRKSKRFADESQQDTCPKAAWGFLSGTVGTKVPE